MNALLANRRTQFAIISVLLVATIVLVAQTLRKPQPKPPFEISFWFWHSPFELSSQDLKELNELGVTRIFVRAGTFTSDGKQALLRIPQTYGKGVDHVKSHLVFNFDSGLLGHFGDFDIHTLAKQVAPRVLAQVAAARKKGVQVEGIQLDVDCPTRLLPRYADLIRAIRWRFKDEGESKLKISATGLMSWLGEPGLDILCRELDFLVPQSYEWVTGKTVDTMRPVSDLKSFRQKAALADRLPCPVYWGLPAYGHAFLFDEKDRLVNIYRGLSPSDALRHPSFRFLEAIPLARDGREATKLEDWVGEQSLKLKAIKPAPDGRGLGYTLTFTIPTPDLIAKHLEAARALQSSNCLGAIVYRFPEPDDSMTIPFASLLKSVNGMSSAPKLRITEQTSRDSFEVIDSNSKVAPTDVTLCVENIGEAAIFVAPDAIELECVLDAPGIADCRLRDFDSVRFDGPAGSATRFWLSKGSLTPGKKTYIGPIRLLTSDAKTINIKWKARASDGFQTHKGTIVLALDSKRSESN